MLLSWCRIKKMDDEYIIEEVLIPIREAWKPDEIQGYLPVSCETITAFEKSPETELVVTYIVSHAPPWTQLSFILDNYKDKGVALCSYDYPETLLRRIPDFTSTEDAVPKYLN